MAIEREGSEWYLQCDTCPTTDGPFFDFAEALAFKQDHPKQWHSVKVDGEWEDRCAECYQRYSSAKRKSDKVVEINFGSD